MRPRIALIEAPCKRCGRPITTTNRSVLGLDALKLKWGVICTGCATSEEAQQLLQEQGEALAKGG